MENEDYLIDNILVKNNKKKSVDSGKKGSRGERTLCKIFKSRFPDKPNFFRIVGSGNRWSQVQLTEESKQYFIGDITSGTGFRYLIECKYGYSEIDLGTALANGNATLDGFLEKVKKDAEQVKKIPLLCWAKERKPWLCFFPETEFAFTTNNYFLYKGFVGMGLTEWLKNKDSYFWD